MPKDVKNDKLYLKINPNDIDPKALFIMRKLNDLGFAAFLVGGCIRDLVLKKNVNDWDISTQATVEEIIESFNNFKIVTVGKKYGTILLVRNHFRYQVSTFKSTAGAQTNLQSDLRLRDFTINSMAWNEKNGFVDLLNGVEDIREGSIKFSESAQDRIKEDPLRMLRAIRLACELDFKIDKITLQAIEENSSLIKKVSLERIRDEFTKMLLSNYPRRGFKLLHRLGLLIFILPELQKCVGICRENIYEGEDLFEHTLEMTTSLPPDLNLRLSVLLYNIKSISRLDEKKEIVVKILQRIRFKNAVIKKVIVLIKENWQVLNFSKKINIRQLASRIGMENLEDVWELKKVLTKGSRSSERFKSVEIERAENNIREVLREKPPVSLKDLAVNGKDLFELGCKEGKELGKILKKLLEIIIDRPELNKKKILLKLFVENEENDR